MSQCLFSILRSFLILLLILDNDSPDIPVSGKHLSVDASDNVLARGENYLLDALYKMVLIYCDIGFIHSESPDYNFTW